MFTTYATDYAPVDPISPPCEIAPIFIGYRGENKARCLVFDLTECVNTFGEGGFAISFLRQGDELPYLVTDTDRLENNAIWIITDTDTAVEGYGLVQLQYIVDEVVCKSALYRTVTFDSNGITGDVPDPYEDLLAQIAAYAAQAEGAATTATAAAQTATTAVENGIVTERSQRIAADNGLQLQITELMGLAGAPSMASTAASMTDSSKVYVYTGSEAGYINGNWYYYNGTEWVSGGVYQATAVNTDKTLTVSDMAADAAVVGEKIDECMAAFVTEQTSGSVASFTDGADGVPLKDLVVNITAVQSGTGDPSPSNVRPITGWTQANVGRCGKNMVSSFITGYTINSGEIVSTYATNWISNRIQIGDKPFVVTIADKGNMGNGSVNIGLYRTDGTYAYQNVGYFNDTLPKSKTYSTGIESVILFGYQSGGATAINTTKIQVEFGTAATEYEPYNGNTYNVSFGSSAGTVYGGTLDVTTGMLTVTHGYMGFTGNMNWQLIHSTHFYAPVAIPTNSTSAVSNMFTYAYNSTTSPCYYYTSTTSGYFVVFGYDSVATTVNEWETWLADNTIQFVYPLASPVSYQLSPTEVKTLLANNNIWSDTGSVASLEYRADTKLYLEKLTNPDDDMVANANITSGSYFMVGNNLYLATAAIASGASIVPGTNCTLTNLASALNAINS